MLGNAKVLQINVIWGNAKDLHVMQNLSGKHKHLANKNVSLRNSKVNAEFLRNSASKHSFIENVSWASAKVLRVNLKVL